MPVGIVRTHWAGTSGGPGLTQTAFSQNAPFNITSADAQAAVNAVRTFWNQIGALLPNELQLTVSPVVDVYNEANGQLISTQSAPAAPANVAGTDAGNYSMASGMKINLNTTTIQNGRRVRGAIYVVPSGATTLNPFGAIATASRNTVNIAGATMKTNFENAGLKLVVYSRPLKDSGGNITRNGTISDVSTLETNEKTAILRGRRD